MMVRKMVRKLLSSLTEIRGIVNFEPRIEWWAEQDLNLRPLLYQSIIFSFLQQGDHKLQSVYHDFSYKLNQI